MSAAGASMLGKICVVTGANGGMGLVVATRLVAEGARVVMLCRDPERGDAARVSVAREANGGEVVLIVADLADQVQVRRAAEQISERYPRIDVLVNNAGAHIQERRLTGEGLEMNLAVNHLASHLLTRLLLPGLQAAAAGRVVNVSSEALRRAASFDDLGAERDFRPFAVYGRAKLAMLLCTYALDRRLVRSRVTVNALHPGLTATGIVDDVAPRALAPTVGFIKLFLRSPAAGAKTTLLLATSSELDGISGQYFRNGKPATSGVHTYNREFQEEIWRVSNELVGLDELAPRF